MVGPKMQAFCHDHAMLKGNRCILRIRGAPVRQKLGMILENKVVQKLELEKNVFLYIKNGNAVSIKSEKAGFSTKFELSFMYLLFNMNNV